uniref:Uncharacterized protein n=1 Tax=Strongyloides venezuelensis TaxID=75913 RepID=A0A0K0FLA5_STRVS
MLINCDTIFLVSIIFFIIVTNVEIGETHGIVSEILGDSHSYEYSYEESGSFEHSHGSHGRRRRINRRRRYVSKFMLYNLFLSDKIEEKEDGEIVVKIK